MTCEVETCRRPAVRWKLCIGHALLWALAPRHEAMPSFLARQAKQARDMEVRVALARTLHSAGE